MSCGWEDQRLALGGEHRVHGVQFQALALVLDVGAGGIVGVFIDQTEHDGDDLTGQEKVIQLVVMTVDR